MKAMETTADEAEVRLFAVSDVHVDADDNRRWVESLSSTAYKNDAIIVAGDMSDDRAMLEQALTVLRAKFAQVFFTPGNHDLWLNREDERHGVRDSFTKLKSILRQCEEIGVHVQGPARVGTAAAGVRVCPLLAWHHASFDTEPDLKGFQIPPVHAIMTDFRNAAWPPPLDPRTDSVARAVDALNDDVLPSVTADADADEPLITFSHFLPRVELLPEKRFLTLPPLAKASGSAFLAARVAQLRPAMHVFGHTHFGWDATLEGVRYVQGALAYPGERQSRWHTLQVGDFGADGPLLLWSSRDGMAPHMHCRWSGYYEAHAREPERVWELAEYAARQWARTDERAKLITPDFSHETGANARAGVRMLEADPAFVKPPAAWHR